MLAIIQARMSSTRLPGKVLMPLAGKPILSRVYDRLRASDQLSEIVVSTSVSTSDTLIYEYCIENSIPVHRGSLNDVVDRLLNCAEDRRADHFVRISGDSPLIDSTLVDRAVTLQRETLCDLATNVQVRSFPKGQSVEVIRTESLGNAWQKMKLAADFEHVTRYFYAHPNDFTIKNFVCEDPIGDYQLSVDTRQDLQAIAAILPKLSESFSWREAVASMQGEER